MHHLQAITCHVRTRHTTATLAATIYLRTITTMFHSTQLTPATIHLPAHIATTQTLTCPAATQAPITMADQQLRITTTHTITPVPTTPLRTTTITVATTIQQQATTIRRTTMITPTETTNRTTIHPITLHSRTSITTHTTIPHTITPMVAHTTPNHTIMVPHTTTAHT